jgi:hypothetical protein
METLMKIIANWDLILMVVEAVAAAVFGAKWKTEKKRRQNAEQYVNDWMNEVRPD